MKANELRIGNYILHKPTIDDWEEIIVTLPSLLQVDISPESYCGIPLTEEWLLKFGFEKKKQGYVLDNGYLKIYYGIIGGIIELDFVSRGGYSGVVTNHIKYVHQLQNAYFALTGEELQIKK